MLLRGRWAGCTSHAVFQVCTSDTFWFSYWRLKEDYSWKPLFSAWIWETDSKDMTVDSDWKCHIIFIFFSDLFLFTRGKCCRTLLEWPFLPVQHESSRSFSFSVLGHQISGYALCDENASFCSSSILLSLEKFFLALTFFFSCRRAWRGLVYSGWPSIQKMSKKKKPKKKTHVGCMFLTLSVFERWGDKFADSSN